MRTKLTIETDQPCLVLVIPLPQRVERPAPRRVIDTVLAPRPLAKATAEPVLRLVRGR